eukprot:gene3794-4317_t
MICGQKLQSFLFAVSFLCLYSSPSECGKIEEPEINCLPEQVKKTEGKLPERRSFKINATVHESRVGRDSQMKIFGDFDCPLLKCDLNFGDGNVKVLRNLANDSIINHKYKLSGEYNIAGVCYNRHRKESIFETKALVLKPLEVDEVIYQKECINMGELYVIKTRFNYATTKQWRIEVNGSLIQGTDGIVSDDGINATVEIPPGIYGGHGRKQLRISVSDSVDDNDVLDTDICVRESSSISLVVVPVAGLGLVVKFKFTLSSSLSGVLQVSFGNSMSSSQFVNGVTYWEFTTSYWHVGDFSYTWTLSNFGPIASGSGTIHIMRHIGNKSDYTFPALISLNWPDTYVQFSFGIACPRTPPGNLEYQIDYGNGVITQWRSMPVFTCYAHVLLGNYTYTEPDCFQMSMEMRNGVSSEKFTCQVNILRALESLNLSLNNLPNVVITEKEKNGMIEAYLRDAYPIEATAVTTGGKCLTFNWTIPSLNWFLNNSKESKIVLNDLIGGNGSYIIELSVSNLINSMFSRKRFVLLKTIVGLQLLSSLPTGQGFIEFYLLLKSPGTNTTYNWNFGDGTLSTVTNIEFSPAVSIPNIATAEGATKLDLNKYLAAAQSHQYTSQGLFFTRVAVTDIFTTLIVTRDVYVSNDKVCKRPAVKIIRKIGQLLSFNFVGELTILTDVQIDCEDSHQVDFNWQLFNSSQAFMQSGIRAESDKLISFPANTVTNKRDLTVKKRSIFPGIYVIKITVEMKGLEFSESDETYMEITREPLYVEIAGSTTKLLSWAEDVILDASKSRDPNLPTADNSTLIYKWYCTVKPGYLPYVIGDGGCLGHGYNLIEYNLPTWTIPAKTLFPDAVYIVRLRLESRLVPGIYSEVDNYLDIKNKTVVLTSIQCKANCQRNIDPETRLSLIGGCTDCGRYKTYNWQLLNKDDFTNVAIEWMVNTLTPQDSVSFVLLPMFLTKNKEYLARFTVTTAWGEVGYADYGFKVSIPPLGGFCNVTPPCGEAIETKFRISCYNWTGSTQTLQYSISFLEHTTSSATLISYGSATVIDAALQQGVEASNYTQTLIIRISDSYGASTETNLTVQSWNLLCPDVLTSCRISSKKHSGFEKAASQCIVRHFNEKKSEGTETKSIETQLEAYVYGTDSTLSKLSGTKDLQQLGRFSKAISKSLDSAKEESNTLVPDETERKTRIEKRKNMRATVVNALTDIELTSLNNFALISSALRDVSSSEDEVNEESQDKMLQFFEGASNFLGQSFEEWSERDPKEIQNALKGFLEAVGNNVESAAVATSAENANLQRSDDQYEKFTNNSLKIINNSTLLLSRSLVVGEPARRIIGESLSIEMKRSEVSKLNSMTMKTMEGGQIQSPSVRSFIDTNSTNITAVDSKMVTLLRNPHILDAENIGRSLTPTISSLTFLSEEKEIDVKNLPENDNMRIEIPNPEAKMSNKSANLTNGKISFVQLRLPAKEVTLFLKIKCFGAPCTIFINYDILPSSSNYRKKFTAPDCANNSNSSINFQVYPSLNTIKFNIGIMYNSSSISNISTNNTMEPAVFYDIQAFISGCFYWHESDSKWSSDGCYLGNETTLNNTICHCNHLTWFGGGFFVQPNALDISAEIIKIKDLADYPALLATVCTIFGCYLIVVVWARRKDGADSFKAKLVIPDTCCQSHKYRYDLTITSGHRPGSSTTASVCTILGGSLAESPPFCLSKHQDVSFQRGSTDSFLITTEQDLGKIEYVRLWHDNAGDNPSWYVSRATVTNILSGVETHFLCQTWLAIGIAEGKIDAVFLAADEDELKNFGAIFLNKTSIGFSDDHVWFSVKMRPPRSNFTRVQRVTCCLCTLLCTMLTNAMFYQRDVAAEGTTINVGSISFNWKQIIIGVQSALIVLPLNILIAQLFRKAAPSTKKIIQEKGQFPEGIDTMQSVEDGLTPSSDRRESDEIVSENDEIVDTDFVNRNIISEDTIDWICALNNIDGQDELCEEVDHINKEINGVSSVRSDGTNSGDFIVKIDEDKDAQISYNTLDIIDNLNASNTAIKSADDQTIKPSFSSSVQNSNEPTALSLDNGDTTKSEKKKKGETVCPHWCQIFAWILCFMAIVTSAFFTLLYGLSFGRVVQEKWLISFFTSIFQDIFISQPVKVLVIGCVFALIIKKLTEDDKLPEIQLAKDDEWINNNLPLQDKNATSSRINIPLSSSYVEKAHNERLKQIRITDVLLETVIYFLYIFLALLIAYGHRAPYAYNMTDNLQQMIITDNFDMVTNADGFWNWSSNNFLPSMYGEEWYNGHKTGFTGFLSDYVTYVVGSPRFRQLRVNPAQCPVTDQYNINRTICAMTYSSSNEDDGMYDEGWKNRSNDNTKKGQNNDDKNPWLHYSQLEINGHPFIADIHSYSGGGYTYSLGISLSEANSSIKYLKENLWIDTFTRAVFIEFTTYNNNKNFFCIVTLLLEFTQDGGAFPYTRIVTTRLDRYNSDFSFFLAACEISFLLLSLYYLWMEFKRFRVKGIDYFKQWSSLIELMLLSLTWATFALLIVRFGVVNWTKNKYKANPSKFTSFQYAASIDLAYGYTLACLIFIAFLKVLKTLRFNKNMLLLYRTLQFASKDLRYYGFLFSIPLLAYIQWAYLLFGSHLNNYVTILRSAMSVVNLLLGSANFYDLQSANRIVGPIFFALIIVTMGFVLINMFLSIIMQAFSDVRRLMALEENKYEIIEFMYDKLTSFFPCLLQHKHRGLDACHNEFQIREYYHKREKGRCISSEVDDNFQTVLKKLDKIEDVLNICLLCEFDELEEFSEHALMLRS